MARVVETVVPGFAGRVEWEKVVTKELAGAMRFGELTRQLGRPAPVPSIFIDGELAFDTTPSTEELEAHLASMLEA
ncbi:MAG: hypothetical protein LJE65_10865 [Desulfobacteraceae bacterium]|nr:hypothetical protein [Desulfobacteraceae bacterium]